jgi:hypothetical protein
VAHVAEKPISVELPKPEADRPRLGRVGTIALVGFVIGIAWPRLAGLQMVPRPPVDESPAAAASSSLQAPPAAAPAPALARSAEPAAPPQSESLQIGPAKVVSCASAKGERLTDCGHFDFDKVARDRLLALGGCKGAQGATGTLSIGFEIDFAKKSIAVLRGKSTTLADATAAALLECAKQELASASLEGLDHHHARYTIFYAVELLPPGEAPVAASGDAGAAAGAEPSAASGLATVAWDVALIRDAPKDGAIVARILRGTRIVVTGKKDEWYRVKYDAKGSEGWVYRTAIGL